MSAERLAAEARLPNAEPQYPLCGACYSETDYDGDFFHCYDSAARGGLGQVRDVHALRGRLTRGDRGSDEPVPKAARRARHEGGSMSMTFGCLSGELSLEIGGRAISLGRVQVWGDGGCSTVAAIEEALG